MDTQTKKNESLSGILIPWTMHPLVDASLWTMLPLDERP
jgi:hypothetical protein